MISLLYDYDQSQVFITLTDIQLHIQVQSTSDGKQLNREKRKGNDILSIIHHR